MSARQPGFTRCLIALWLAGTALAACESLDAQRFRAMPPVSEVVGHEGWYRPLARVVGRAVPWPLAPAPIAPAAATLERLAADTQSLAVVVVRDGQLAWEWYAAGVDAATRFDTQSLHKGVLALLAGAALADGAFRSLDEPVADFIPAWRGDGRRDIRLRDLLYFQSGLTEPAYAPKLESPGLQMFIGTDLARLITSQRSRAPPGTLFHHGYTDTAALGLALEAATRRPYAEYLSRRLWQSIGAGKASVRLDHAGGHARAFCCLEATARDWARVGEVILERGSFLGERVLPASWIAQLETPAPRNPGIGIYWWRASPYSGSRLMSEAPRREQKLSAPFAADDLLFAEGRGGQRVYVVRSRGLVIVRIGHIRDDWDDAAFANTVIEALAPAATARGS